ncbi:MAG: MFS transporter, partial [Chloroflexota bacterium]
MIKRAAGFLTSHQGHGWTFVGVAFLAWFFLGGVRDTFGVFIRPWADSFGWSVAAISLASSIHMVVNGLAGPLLGSLVDRFGSKPVFLGLVVLMAAGSMGVAAVHELWQLYLLYGVTLGLASNLTPVTSPLVARWFQKRRGLAFSLVPAGNHVGLAVLAPVAMRMSQSAEWRVVWLLMGMATLILVPIVLLLVKAPKSPPQPASQGRSDATTLGATPTGATLGQAIRSRTFWLLAAGFFVCGYTARMFWTLLVPIALEGGMTSGQVAALASVSGLIAVPGLLLFGTAADRVSRSGLLAANFATRVLAWGAMALYLVTGSVPLMFVGAI